MRDLILNSKCLVSFLDENVIEATLSLNLISISKENKLEGQYAQSKGGGGGITTNTDSNSTSDVIPVLYTVGF